MTMIAWVLSQDCKTLSIYKINPDTRLLSAILHLKRSKPMLFAEAQKYVDDNYPNDGSVKAAADTLSLLTKKRTR